MIIPGSFVGSFPFSMATTAMQQQHVQSATSAYPREQYFDQSEFSGSPVAMSRPTTVGRQMLCGYPSKICTNERAWKRDGSLHRFCEEHRQRANTNQKRWAKRKTRAKPSKNAGSASMPAVSTPTEEYQVDDSMLQAESPMDLFDFDMTLEALIRDAKFWSPTASDAAGSAASQWVNVEETAVAKQDEDALEAELWAALGLGNINIAM